MTTLYLPIGVPGCGKSTFARELAQMGLFTEQAIIEPDHYREILTGDRARQDGNRTVFDICRTICKTRLRNGLPVYFDATNLLRSSLDELAELALGYADVISIPFDVPVEELHQRNASREHAVPSDVIDRMNSQFCSLTKLPGTVMLPSQVLTLKGAQWNTQST